MKTFLNCFDYFYLTFVKSHSCYKEMCRKCILILKGDLGTHESVQENQGYKRTYEKKQHYHNEYDCNSRQSFEGLVSKEKNNTMKPRAC